MDIYVTAIETDGLQITKQKKICNGFSKTFAEMGNVCSRHYPEVGARFSKISFLGVFTLKEINQTIENLDNSKPPVT